MQCNIGFRSRVHWFIVYIQHPVLIVTSDRPFLANCCFYLEPGYKRRPLAGILGPVMQKSVAGDPGAGHSLGSTENHHEMNIRYQCKATIFYILKRMIYDLEMHPCNLNPLFAIKPF